MKVLLPLHGFIKWNGGLDLVRLITSALSHPAVAPRIELHFAFPIQPQHRRLLFSAIRYWRSFRAGNFQADAGGAKALQKIAANITSGHPTIVCRDDRAGILSAAKAVDADIIFPAMFPLGASRQRKIGYIFDFQHHYLPQLFSSRMRRNRDRQFANIASDANAIVVNSHAVAQDVVELLGIPAEHILVMPFTPYAQPWWFDTLPEDVLKRYGIQGPFLLICNHFWTHKDHATALEAFALLKKSPKYEAFSLVLTGDPVDHRDPQHYGRLLARSEALGIRTCTHYLGLIPKPDQLALLRGCRLLLQPTTFEGGPGGGSVYEAIGLGIPAVVSDIPINREIDVGNIRFFKTGDASSLATQIEQALATETAATDQAMLLADADARLSRLGLTIASFLANILGHQQ